MPGPAVPSASPTGPGVAGQDDEPELSGKLLVAAPRMVDPNFARTVVLVLHHDLGGSLGLVLNRPSQLDLDEPLAQWSYLSPDPKVVFVGGPVASAAAICLARLREGDKSAAGGAGEALFELAFETPQGWRSIGGRVGTLDLNGDPAAAGLSVDVIRVFAGYAGWGPGQLTAELGLGGWMVVDSVEDDPFSADPGGLWRTVLRRQSPEVAILANYPEDPSVN
jgi:putative transcriptional regulator